MSTILTYRSKPCDLILGDWFTFKYCSHGWAWSKCLSELRQYFIIDKSKNLFKHIGKISSLQGQIRDISENDPKPPPSKTRIEGVEHKTPSIAARLVTTLKGYKSEDNSDASQRILNQVYTGTDIFWAVAPKKGDTIYIIFNEVQNKLQEINILTSTVAHPADKLPASTEVYAVIHETRIEDKQSSEEVLAEMKSYTTRRLLGYFGADGSFKKEGAEVSGLSCAAIEIRVVENPVNWAIIRDIRIL